MKRERGFYWVRLRDYQDNPFPWAVAEWYGDGWYFAAMDEEFQDVDMVTIDEQRLIHEEKEGGR